MDEFDTKHSDLASENASLQLQIQKLKEELGKRDAIGSRAEELVAQVRRLGDDKKELVAELEVLRKKVRGIEKILRGE
jgi:regulator of replication initiation timing